MLVGLVSVLIVLILLTLARLLKLGSDSRSLSVSVGIVEGRLGDCPSTPNCVSSAAPPADSHYIAPIADPVGSKWAALVDSVQAMPGARLLEQRENYVYFTFTTGLWRFVDDLEFHRRPEAAEIAMRSASRVGRSDLGVNRRRLEAIRAAL